MTQPQPGYPPPYPPPPGINYPPPPSAPPAPPRPRKNPLLGRLSLAVAGVMAAAATVAVIPLATLQAQTVVSVGSTDIPPGLLTEVWSASAMTPMLIWLVSILGSLAAIIAGIIALATARGRISGALAVVVGVLSPVAWIACWLIVVLPAVRAVS